MHHTATTVDEDIERHIQDVCAALVDDQRRTDQICDDVHDAAATGRTCLVLTQRTDHIDTIFAGLASQGLVHHGHLPTRHAAHASRPDAARTYERIITTANALAGDTHFYRLTPVDDIG